MTKTLKSAVVDLEKVLKARQTLEASIQDKLETLKAKQAAIEEFIATCQDERLAEVPEIVAEACPFVAWQACEQNDGATIRAHMEIDDRIIPSIENERKAAVAQYRQQLEVLEGIMLQRLTEAGTNSTSVTGIGRCEKRIETKYSIPDKTLFVRWATENGAESELTVSLRPNSKFMAKTVEELGELPPGTAQSRSYKCVFVKN